MKISFITTIFNEEKTIKKFFDSIIHQTKLPDEIIIVDGGSDDATVSIIKYQLLSIKDKNLKRIKFKILVKKGNRSVGRNEAIKNATGDFIVCSDAGNVLDKDWVKNITKPFVDKNVEVVSGYYKGQAKNIFQKCLIPYVLVMPDKVNPDTFLPATRSISFKKSIWEKVGGFPEEYSHNEDFVFANRLKDVKAKIVFAKDAIVYWIPRTTVKQSFIMFFRFALGDAEAGILRTNVLLLVLRYTLGLYFIFLSILYRSFIPVLVLTVGFFLYILWSIIKNYKYVKDKRAFKLLPLLQFIADFAVMSGTVVGELKKIIHFNYFLYIKQNKLLIFIISCYIFIMLLTLQWGIPNQTHPFNYQMDEWHQSQAVRNVFAKGTPNIEGSANGSMFHFLLSGFYLIPFFILGILNPFAIKSSVTSLEMQQRLFEILRLNTLVFGVLSVFVLAYIAKKYFKFKPWLVALIFIVNPMWFSFSNYFKYDIALIFWLLLGFLFLLRFVLKPTTINYFIAGAICAISFAVKLSALPLLGVYILTFLGYFPRPFKNFWKLIMGIIIYISIFVLLGVPDLVFGRGNIYEYLDANLRRSPGETSNYILGMDYVPFFLAKLYPYHFGHVMYFFIILSVLFFIISIIKKSYSKKISVTIKKIMSNKLYLLLFIIFVFFLISLIPLKIEARSNRVLVLLPFAVLFINFFLIKIYSWMKNKLSKIIFLSIIIVCFLLQAFETFGWTWTKFAPDPRTTSSIWLEQNLKNGTQIGIENIPIYQMLPDVVVKEFYSNQYGLIVKNRFEYQIVTSKTPKLPSVIIITNGKIESMYLHRSNKKDLIKRLQREKYKKTAEFMPDFRYYSIYGDSFVFYMSNLVSSPTSITIFSK